MSLSIKVENLDFLEPAESEPIEGAVSVSTQVSAVYSATYDAGYGSDYQASYAITGRDVSAYLSSGLRSAVGVAFASAIAVGGIPVASASTSAIAQV